MLNFWPKKVCIRVHVLTEQEDVRSRIKHSGYLLIYLIKIRHLHISMFLFHCHKFFLYCFLVCFHFIQFLLVFLTQASDSVIRSCVHLLSALRSLEKRNNISTTTHYKKGQNISGIPAGNLISTFKAEYLSIQGNPKFGPPPSPAIRSKVSMKNWHRYFQKQPTQILFGYFCKILTSLSPFLWMMQKSLFCQHFCL